MKDLRASTKVLHELSRISAAHSIAVTFIAELPDSKSRTALQRLFDEINAAQICASANVHKIRASAEAI